LDLTNGYYVYGTSIVISYEALGRPNRFNLYINGSLSQSTPWLGSDTSYPAGYEYYVPTGTTTNGTFTFNYNPTYTYEILVDIAPENPNNPVNDSYQINVSCPTIPATPTPTVTQTATSVNYCAGGSNLSVRNGTTTTGWKWFMYETGYNNFQYPSGTYDPTTKTLIGLPAIFYPPSHYYPGYMRVIVWNCSLQKFYILDQWTVNTPINMGGQGPGKPIRNFPSNVLTNLPTELDKYQGNKFTVAPFNT
jgi:hypothetical protein